MCYIMHLWSNIIISTKVTHGRRCVHVFLEDLKILLIKEILYYSGIRGREAGRKCDLECDWDGRGGEREGWKWR